jgi:hypothetical protein
VYSYRDIGYRYIPISIVEFSNTFKHECRDFPMCSCSHCGILQHFTTCIEELPLFAS